MSSARSPPSFLSSLAHKALASGSRTDVHLYKILVVGEFGVGKTSLIRRYTDNIFNPHYKLTIGVDFALKTLNSGSFAENNVHLQLWDIAGHERFGYMTHVYYKYAIAAVCVFDLSRPVTFDAINKWVDDLHSKVVLTDGSPIPILLLANKCDVDNVKINENYLAEYCQARDLLGWFVTSAKNYIGINEAMDFLVRHVLGLGLSSRPKGHDACMTSLVDLDDDDDESDSYHSRTSKGGSCCAGTPRRPEANYRLRRF